MSAFFHVDLTCLVLRVFLGPQNVDNVESTFFVLGKIRKSAQEASHKTKTDGGIAHW